MPLVHALEKAAEPVAAARAAGLRYVSDQAPGIRRTGPPKRFRYLRPDGRPLKDALELERIRALAIPPAWKNVWICPLPNGHIQATGRDARGRKQYRYHRRWREVRDQTKYHRMIAFGCALPRIRRAVARDLGRPGLSREKVLATVVRLLETSLIRVGNEQYARENGSFGLTTLRDRHVDVDGATLHFEFRGKSNQRRAVDVTDRRLARIVRRCQELPGHELFQYVDDSGARHGIDSADVNDYLHRISGEELTAKDFRTWQGTACAIEALLEGGPARNRSAAKRKVARAIDRVAARLGNTRSVCLKCYVHPAVIDAYRAGALDFAAHPSDAAIVRFLRRRRPPPSRGARTPGGRGAGG